MADQDYKFEGWMGLDSESAKGKLVWQEFKPKTFEDTDVDIEITHCGICATDLHTLRSGHGPVSHYHVQFHPHTYDRLDSVS